MGHTWVRKTIEKEYKMSKKIHLGCWHRYIPGFLHVDLCDFLHVDYKTSIDKLTFLDNESASLIYCSHSLEYFDRQQVSHVLKEWLRVLKPGGLLRLAVPDFESLLQVYRKTGDLNKILGPIYGRMEITTSNENHIIYHKTIYDEKSLSALLQDNGFKNIERWNWRETEHSNIDDHSQAYYPHMDKKDGILISLNIQATKK